uniref:Large ribosomal subunit protein uL15/eL18 domain-containing protein n=1 Tax=Gossypium raimondii TaxID=29730 RepID=A0A0D2NFC5_GOSRA|nr:hypothetical protein B456_005G191400 [Gossypium raimondii]
MAAMLSLSPNPPITTLPSLRSTFKGNLRNLKPNPFHIIRIRTKQQGVEAQKGTRSLVVVNQAATTQVSVTASNVRFRLDNLGPQPGSRKKGKRKGRGISGGQMPLYRRIPKLRGIAGGMHAGLPKYIPVNLKDIETAGFQEGDEVSLETLKEKGLINPSGRERKLPLKILGDGELKVKLNLKARAFSASAKEKLEAAGCSLTVLPGRKKWVKPSVAKNLARAEEYFAKKRAASSSDSTSA